MKKLLIYLAIILAIVAAFIFQQWRISQLTKERDRNKTNVVTLMEDVTRYRTADSLNAAQVGVLELKVKEFERYRAADAELIKTLKIKNRDLTAVTKSQSETILAMSAIPRDTVIIRDSVEIPAIAVHCGDPWYDFDGLLTNKEFTGTLAVRDSLLVAETVQYKRFLGFLWKTKRIKNKRIDVVSKNPHTVIVDTEYIVIEK